MITWCLVKLSPYEEDAFWYQDKRTHYLNTQKGLKLLKTDAMIVLEKVKGGTFEELNHTLTGIVSKDPACGWLSPEGKMHSCSHYFHDQYARLILGKYTSELEKAGWCRLSSYVYFEKPLTDNQEIYLLNIGRHPRKSS